MTNLGGLVTCDICGKDVDELDAHYPCEPDCPRRHTDIPCDCDITACAACCPDCPQEPI